MYKNLRVFLISSSNKQNFLIRKNLYKFLENENYKVSFIGDGPGEPAYSFIKWPYSSKRNLLGAFFSFFTLLLIIIRYRPTHIISFAPKSNLYCQIISKFIKFNHCLVITGLGESIKYLNKGNLLLKKIFNCIDSQNSILITMNNIDEDILKKNGINKSRFYKIPGEGYSLKFCNQDYLNRKRPIDIVFISRIIESKGIFEFLKCSAILKKNNENIVVKVIGKVDLNNSQKNKFYAKIRNEDISYCGYVNEDTKNQILLNSKVLVLPTKYGEGLPFILLEAQDAGCNVVISDNPTCFRALSFLNSDLISECNPTLIADKVGTAINRFNSSNLEDIKESRKWINNNFSSEITINKYKSIFVDSKFFS
jgi:glycosyltransferase involved in cell wall biosynthesis